MKFDDIKTELEDNASLPSWERGLKSENKFVVHKYKGRSPRGSVD